MKHIQLYEQFNETSRLDSIVYGHPAKEHRDTAGEKSPIRDRFIETGLAQQVIDAAPANSSAITKRDLEQLLQLADVVTAEELQFARYVEDVSNLAQVYIDLLAEHGIELSMGEWFGVDAQIEPLCFWLKEKINRPRPYQLAPEYGLPLWPTLRTDANSASYPSGHAMSAYVMSEYLARQYPALRSQLEALGERVAKSRELVGVHYPSDTQISKWIAAQIFRLGLL